MKLTFNRLFSRMSSNKGYTIDQTILIVAIIAILITLVIVTVGWQLINRSSGTKVGAQLKQVEDANGQFFSTQHAWPQQALAAGNPTAAQMMNILVQDSVGTGLAYASNIDTTQLTNMLPGFKVAGGAVYHGFGSGTSGVITEQVNRMSATSTDYRIVVQFAGVPLAQALEADHSIDSEENAVTGRLTYGTTACVNGTFNGTIPTMTAGPTASTVFVCYSANQVQ